MPCTCGGRTSWEFSLNLNSFLDFSSLEKKFLLFVFLHSLLKNLLALSACFYSMRKCDFAGFCECRFNSERDLDDLPLFNALPFDDLLQLSHKD